MMSPVSRTSRVRSGTIFLCGVLVVVAGCQQLRVPAFDPTGQRIFSSTESMRPACLGDSRATGYCFSPRPAWEQPLTPQPCPEPPPAPPPGVHAPASATLPAATPRRHLHQGVPGQIMLSPTRMIAPVGSEVVLVCGMCGEDGYLITQQPIEFMLSQDSVGQFVEISDKDRFWCRSEKLSADYAIARTSTRSQVVTRGTTSVTDDVVQEKGQCWVSITSASQGTSYVTAVAARGATWPQRRRAAMIHWVDAQWAFPDPVSVSAGQPHTLSTTVKRTATGAPVVGFIVRYEVVDGTTARFGPDTTVVEVLTDQEGVASAVLQPLTGNPGVTQVRIAVIKPADPTGDAPRTQLGEGFTSVTWSAPGLALHASGPRSATVDSTLVYRLEVSNPGDLPTRNVEVRDVLPPSLKFVSSNPAAQIFGNQAIWNLAEIPPKGVQAIEVNVRADAAGAVRYAFQAASGEGVRAEAYVDTEITRPSLALAVNGPDSAVVGERVEFRIEVTNHGSQALDNVTITDHFDSGLQHAEGLPSPIEKLLGRLEPGETKLFAVTFVARRPGQVCHVLEVAAPGGQEARTQVCLAVTQPAASPQPALQLTVSTVPQALVGQNVLFTANVVNAGNTPLSNVRVAATFDQQFERKEATPGFDYALAAAGEEVLWRDLQLQPGQSLTLSVLCRCKAEAEAAVGRVTATAQEGVSQAAQASVRILSNPTLQPGPATGPAPGPAAGELQVAIDELSDPIAIDGSTTYMISVKNARAVPDQDLRLTLEFPPGLQFVSLIGLGQRRTVSQDGRTVKVDPIREMRAGEALPVFRVQAIGRQAGDHVLQVTVTSRLTPQGVQASEVTTVTAQ